MTNDIKMIGPYEVQGVIGSGGMGVVYRAVQPSLKRFVAIKVLPAHLAQNRELVQRFQREARSVAALDHPNIVTIYDIGESDGAYYFVMKFLVGDTLEEHIEEEGRLPLSKALLFAEQLVDALGTAHQSGVIHRDVKPANIIVDPRGRKVVLTDFGIALTLEETRLTRPGTMFGSPIFIAPEQLEGDDVDHRADFYSLGGVLYQMLTGRPPYEGSLPVAILHQRLKDPERSVREINPEVPEAVDRLVMRLMARDPGDRLQTAGDVLEALRDLRVSVDKPVPPVESSPDLTVALGTMGEPAPDPVEPAEPEDASAEAKPDAPVADGASSLSDAPEEPEVPVGTVAAASPPAVETPQPDLPIPPAVIPPPVTHPPRAASASTTQRLVQRVGMRRIIVTWIGVMAVVLIILMVVVWWTGDSGTSTEEAELQASLEQPAGEETAAGAANGEEGLADAASQGSDDLSTAPVEAGQKEGEAEPGGRVADQAKSSVEPAAAGKDAAGPGAAEEPPAKKDIRPTEVTPGEPVDKPAVKPPSAPRTSSRTPAPPKVSGAEMTAALEAAQSSRQSAFEAGAPEYAPQLWAAGEAKLEAGAGHKSGKRPDLEKAAYGEAWVLFGKALDKAAPEAETARMEAEAGQAELAGLATRIEQGISAGTVDGLEDGGEALVRFRGIAPEDTRLDRFSARLDEAKQRLWQTHGMTRTYAIAQGVEMEFIWIPPGTFRMGTTAPTKGTHSDESPKHTVVISKGFWLGKFEVTQAQWQAVTGSNPSRFKSADNPVDRVSWNDAQAFVARLNDSAGAGRFRLPTEAQWEYACRAGTLRSFCGGEINTVGCENEDHLAPWAWYCYNAENTTHPVGQKQPNGWGFHDMHGNVGEWCSDYYDRNYYEYTPTRDPLGPEKGRSRILRGGGWDFRAWNCRSAYRGRYKPSANNNSFGIRIVRTAD